MKKIIYLAFGLVCLLVLPFSVQAQYYTGVLEVYYQSFAYPETFDQFVADNQSLFDDKFFSCLNSLVQYWKSQADQEREICGRHLDPEWRAKCIKDAQFIGMETWPDCLHLVLSGQQEWADTTCGAAAILGKSLAPDLWVQAINMALQNEVFKRLYLCQYN